MSTPFGALLISGIEGLAVGGAWARVGRFVIRMGLIGFEDVRK